MITSARVQSEQRELTGGLNVSTNREREGPSSFISSYASAQINTETHMECLARTKKKEHKQDSLHPREG